ncbi:MAG: PKD domain-containing protein [Thermoplasmata archaeon]|nr:PKD domain-containing protein [Thermoplasmata archaeon]
MTASHRPLWTVAAIATVALALFGGFGGLHLASPAAHARTGNPLVPSAAASTFGATTPSSGTWTHLPSTTGAIPTLRTGASAAYDSMDGYVVLFGGCGRACPQGDTWTYLHGGWANLTTNLTVAPPARSGAAMVYDPTSHAVVLFGGLSAAGPLSDTWIFRTGQWHQVVTAGGASPPARSSAALASDWRDGEVVLFGGVAANGTTLGDTWVFYNGAWQPVTGGNSPTPAARAGAMATYYPSSGYVLLYGGRDAGGATLADSWSFTSNAWQRIAATGAASPAGRSDGTLVFDKFFAAAMLFGGTANGTVMSDTWLFNQGVWTNLTPVIGRSPTPRSGAAGAYDLVDGYTLLFGGSAAGALASASWIFVHPFSDSIAATPTTVAPGATVNFDAIAQGGILPYKFIWHFGDASLPSNLSVTTHAYAVGGSYRAQLNAYDARGATVFTSLVINVAYPPLVVQLTVVPTPVAMGSNATFVATSFGGAGTIQFVWTGLPATCGAPTTSNISCRFNAPGDYLVNVGVSDVHGDAASASTHLAVTVSSGPAIALVGPNPAVQTFDRFGWVLVPPLAGATAMAALSAWVTFVAWKRAKLEGPQLLCYMPAEWKETPDEFVPP